MTRTTSKDNLGNIHIGTGDQTRTQTVSQLQIFKIRNKNIRLSVQIMTTIFQPKIPIFFLNWNITKKLKSLLNMSRNALQKTHITNRIIHRAVCHTRQTKALNVITRATLMLLTKKYQASKFA